MHPPLLGQNFSLIPSGHSQLHLPTASHLYIPALLYLPRSAMFSEMGTLFKTHSLTIFQGVFQPQELGFQLGYVGTGSRRITKSAGMFHFRGDFA